MNFLNRDKTLEQKGSDCLSWKAFTTGNYGGFDALVEAAGTDVLKFETSLISFDLPLSEIGLEDKVFDASGDLPRFVKVFRLPTEPSPRTMSFTREVPLQVTGDNAIYIRLTQEDGTRAWISPVYVYR